MSARARASILATAAVAAAVACDANPAGPAPSTTAVADAPSVASSVASAPAPPHSAAEPPPPRKLECRALSVEGTVTRRGSAEPLRTGSTVDASWLVLEAGSRLALRHPTSSREWTLRGPALVKPCVDGEEDLLLPDGTVESTAGAGARPGAQVSIWTPLGTISYGDARIVVRASAKKVEITANNGEAWIAPVAGLKAPPKVTGPKGKVVLTGGPSLDTLAQACEKAATEAEALARAVLEPNAGPDAGSLGDRAAAHVRARQVARGACGAALAAAAVVPDQAKRQDLEARLGRADRTWRAVPSPTKAGGR